MGQEDRTDHFLPVRKRPLGGKGKGFGDASVHFLFN
jgi:hypothetical protein